MRAVIHLILAISLQTDQPPSVSIDDARMMADQVTQYRRLIEDTTSIDYCAIGAAWSAAGEFVGSQELVRFTRREQCVERRNQSGDQVIVTRMEWTSPEFGIVESKTIRGGTTIYEEYTFRRSPIDKESRGTTYSVVRIIAS